MAATISGYTHDVLKDYYGCLAISQVWEEDHPELSSTSPFTITDITPRVRIDPQVVMSGEIHGSTFLSFGSVNGSLHSKINELKIFICPKTGNEFTENQLEDYRSAIRHKCDYTVSNVEFKVDEMAVIVTIVRPDDTEVEKTYKHVMQKVNK